MKCLCLTLGITLLLAVKSLPAQTPTKPAQQWADSLLSAMSLDEKIGQLFMIEVHPKINGNTESVEKLIRKYKVGGLIFFDGNAKKQATITNRFQSISKTPLLIGINAESGLGTYLDDAISYPEAMTLGAIQNNVFLYNMGAEIARQCKRIGVNINFAPVLDLSHPSTSSAIHHTFGEEKEWVTRKGIAYMRGLQYNHVLACAKHFSLHEQTPNNDHPQTIQTPLSVEELRENRLYPFRSLSQGGLQSMMIGHSKALQMNDPLQVPSSLSSDHIHGVIRDEFGFEGLTITDALKKKEIKNKYSAGEAELKAFLAGNDIILQPISLYKGITAIKTAYENGEFPIEFLDQKVSRILRAKYFAGLHKKKRVSLQNIQNDLHTPSSEALKRDLYEQAITVVKNQDNTIPVRETYLRKFSVITIGGNAKAFTNSLENYADFERYTFKGSTLPSEKLRLYLPELQKQDAVILAIYPSATHSKTRYGISSSVINAIQTLQKHTKVITVFFGSPYGLKYLSDAEHLICAYEQDRVMQESVAQLIFGAIEAKGVLPVSVDHKLAIKTGVRIKSIGRLGYASPENVGMDSEVLKGIDAIVKKGIREQAMPGCQVLVAKDGKIIYEKSFGYQTYKKARKITNKSIYDLASITKVAGTLQGLMYLTDHNNFDIHQKVKEHLPETDSTNKGSMVIKNILMHCAGLKSGYFFWGKVKNGRSFNYKYIRRNPASGFSVKVSNKVYAKDSIQKDMWKWFLDTGLSADPNINGIYPYKYSDLGYYIFQKIIERQTHQQLNDFLNEKFYLPLGLRTMTYNPLEKFNYYRLVPTEMDNSYRKNLVRGYVHDPSAALWGGVAGHAGLFSNAHDLAILMQMNLQGGYYGGQRFFKEEVMELYNSQPYSDIGNHRALGWDKPRFSFEKGQGPTSFAASPKTFGHTGFTGTCAWADPEHNLVYIFLSNRVYPYAGNKKLVKKNIRERIQSVIYKSMGIVNEEDHVFEQEQ